MKKQELIDLVSEEIDSSKASTEKTLDALLRTIKNSVATGETVVLDGFGSFATHTREERTIDGVKHSATTTVRFTAGKGFKDAVSAK